MTAAVLVPAAAVVGLLGLAVGSFLNVVVHRVPAGLSVVHPRSACPVCDSPVRERDNLPVVSWLLLRGRCRDCATPISARYPAVEAATALLFVTVAWRLADAPLAVVAASLTTAAAGLALALIDAEHGRLPFAITRVLALLVLAALVPGWLWAAASAGPSAAGVEATRALTGAAAWLAVYGGLRLLTRGRGMGLGDVALAPVLGLVLGAVGTAAWAVGLAAGFVLGGMVGAVLLVRRPALGRRMPFGPYLVAGAAVGLFAGEPLAGWYLRVVGLG